MPTWQALEDFVTRYTYAPESELATQWLLDEFLAMGLEAEFHLYNQDGVRRNVIATLLVGGVLAWLTRWARETVRAAVELEAANRRIPQEQAELIAEGKMTSLTQLVAGIAHELPSPPGQSNSRHRHVVGTSEDLNAALEQRIAAQHASAGG